MNVDDQVNISLAVGRYLRASDKHTAAIEEFSNASIALRNLLETQSRLVVRIEYEHYLVTRDGGNDFGVTKIDVI